MWANTRNLCSKYFKLPYLLRSMSWESLPGRVTVTPVGAADISNFLTVLRHRPSLTRALYIVLQTTEIGGCRTLGKKLLQHNKFVILRKNVNQTLYWNIDCDVDCQFHKIIRMNKNKVSSRITQGIHYR